MEKVTRKIIMIGNSDARIIVKTACEKAGIDVDIRTFGHVYPYKEYLCTLTGEEKTVNAVISNLDKKWNIDGVWDKNGIKIK